jgi:hypothetical protein
MEGSYPGKLQQAVCQGLANGAGYFEIYAVDVLNMDTKIQNAIKAVHDPALCN